MMTLFYSSMTRAYIKKKKKTSRYLRLAVDLEARPLQKPLEQTDDSERQDFPGYFVILPTLRLSCLAC